MFVVYSLWFVVLWFPYNSCSVRSAVWMCECERVCWKERVCHLITVFEILIWIDDCYIGLLVSCSYAFIVFWCLACLLIPGPFWKPGLPEKVYQMDKTWINQFINQSGKQAINQSINLFLPISLFPLIPLLSSPFSVVYWQY